MFLTPLLSLTYWVLFKAWINSSLGGLILNFLDMYDMCLEPVSAFSHLYPCPTSVHVSMSTFKEWLCFRGTYNLPGQVHKSSCLILFSWWFLLKISYAMWKFFKTAVVWSSWNVYAWPCIQGPVISIQFWLPGLIEGILVFGLAFQS